MADCRICVQDCSIHEDVWKALKENCRNYKPKPITNADRIRNMTDEELADEILKWFNWLNAVEWDDDRIINWLKQEGET